MESSIRHVLGAYRKNLLDRRKLLKSVIAVTGGYTASKLVLEPIRVGASPFPQDAPAGNVDAETVHYPFGDIQIEAYLAKPKGDSKYPAVLVIHDRGGLNGAIRDVTKRFAGEGFVALAPDLLSRAGGTGKFKGAAELTAAVNRIPIDAGLDDLAAGFDYLKNNPNVNAQKISAVGFGWGGWRSFSLASKNPELYRAVVFYGSTPVEGLEGLHAPVLANYAQFDFRNTGNAIPTGNTMKELGKKFTYFDYPNTYAGFFNAGPRFDADAAKLAWTRTLDFLRS